MSPELSEDEDLEDIQDNIQSAKMELVDKSHEVSHEQPDAGDIHDVDDNLYVHGDHCGAEVEMVSSGIISF